MHYLNRPGIGTVTRSESYIQDSLQAQEQLQKSRIIRSSKPSHRVPAFGDIETIRATAWVVSYSDIMQDFRVRILFEAISR